MRYYMITHKVKILLAKKQDTFDFVVKQFLVKQSNKYILYNNILGQWILSGRL